MESIRLCSTGVIWTRSVVLILSIFIVVLSLSIYNYNSIPVFLLLEEEASSAVLKGHQIIYDMIQDRRLIATLVAAQASIFCPLFLLMSSSPGGPTLRNDELVGSKSRISTFDIWRTVIEQFCQFLMPLGLAMSWIFCITFDKRTEAALLDHNNMMGSYLSGDQNQYWALAAYVANGLKYIIIGILMLEVLIIWVSLFKYAIVLFVSQQQQAIRLNDDDEEYIRMSIDEDEQQYQEEKVLYI